MTTPHAALPRQLAKETGVSSDARWFHLRGGRTNTSWRVEEGEATFVCKLYSATTSNPLFPNDPEAEFSALTALVKRRLAPAPIALHTTTLGVCVFYEYLFSKEPAPPRAVGETLAALHQTPLSPRMGFRQISNDANALRAHGHHILSHCRGTEMQALAKEAPPAPELHKAPAVFLHGDLVPSNIIATSNGVRFIDWQCPAIGDPCHDLAMFLSPAMQLLYAGKALTAEHAEEFLLGYGDPAVVARYRLLAPLFHWRMACYALWKTQQGDMDYQAALHVECAALNKASG
jgi:fructosamine-3-kinase